MFRPTPAHLIKDIYYCSVTTDPIFLASYPLAFHHSCVSHFGSEQTQVWTDRNLQKKSLHLLFNQPKKLVNNKTENSISFSLFLFLDASFVTPPKKDCRWTKSQIKTLKKVHPSLWKSFSWFNKYLVNVLVSFHGSILWDDKGCLDTRIPYQYSKSFKKVGHFLFFKSHLKIFLWRKLSKRPKATFLHTFFH